MPADYVVNLPTQMIPAPATTHAQVTVSSTSIVLLNSISLAPNTTHVRLQFLGATARVTFDGSTNATASTGFQYVAGSTEILTREMAQAARAIREGATDVTVVVQQLNYR